MAVLAVLGVVASVLTVATTSSAAATRVTLVAPGSAWRFLDVGRAPPASWRTAGFDDSTWRSGRAELGYGDGDERTLVRRGRVPDRPRITTYFRRTFPVADPSRLTSVALRLRRDDGAAVYVNGTEVARSNLPAGALTATTQAVSATTSETRWFAFAVPPWLLVAGTNTIAVEVHQKLTSGVPADLSMDLGLTATVRPPATIPTTTAPPPPTSLPPNTAGDLVTLLPKGSTWRYDDLGTDRGTAWRGTSFDDSSWGSGAGQLGYGDGDEATVVGYGPDPLNKYRTTYFRSQFTVDDPSRVSQMLLGVLRDDGAVVYVNGKEVARSNMPSGYITSTTSAVSWDTSETSYFPFVVPPSVLVAGTNVVAVEVHQHGWASTDLSFDLYVKALLSTGGPTTTRPPVVQQPVAAPIFAVGDIGSCDWNEDEQVAALLASQRVGTLLALGDITYGDGSYLDLLRCYDPAWGQFLPKTRPVLGNHEYTDDFADGFRRYFADVAPASGYTSFTYNGWLVFLLDSNCRFGAGCGPQGDMYRYVRDTLADHPGTCVAAAWHHSPFSSEEGYDPPVGVQTLLQLLVENGLDVLLAGHAHLYERFARTDPNGAADPNGFRLFTVGTGGTPLRTVVTPPLPASQVRNITDHGALQLTLQPHSYSWRFLPVAGGTFTDTGSDSC